MTKSKEILITLFFVGLFFLYSWKVVHAQEAIKCYPNAEFMKLIDEKAHVTLYNGEKNNKINEVMMTKDRHLYVVQYDKASDGNALKANQYCVIGVLDDVTFNDSAIEFLSKLLDKYKGQKT